MEDLSEYDFIGIESKRSALETEINEISGEELSEKGNTMLDMRINSIETDIDNIVTIKMIFKLVYIPLDIPDAYVFWYKHDIKFFDRNRVFEKDPEAVLCRCHLAIFYKETGERLYEQLNETSKRVFARELDKHEISDLDAQTQMITILENYVLKNSK